MVAGDGVRVGSDGDGRRWRLCVHADVATVVGTYELDKIACEAGEAVSVGNVDCAYTAVKDARQKPLETGAAEVEPAADVRVDAAGLGVPRLEFRDLAAEVVGLLAGGDAGVDDDLALVVRLRFLPVVVVVAGPEDRWAAGLLRSGGRGAGEDGGGVVEASQAPLAAGQGDVADASVAGPSGECAAVDAKEGFCGPRGDISGGGGRCDIRADTHAW